MRLSKHNGRSGSHGTYNPKHNDRQFDVERADGVKEDMTPSNIYWNCIDDRIVSHRDLGENDLSFVEAEKRFYEITYGDYLTNQNERHIATRHKERCRTMDQLREDPKTCPEDPCNTTSLPNTESLPNNCSAISAAKMISFSLLGNRPEISFIMTLF